jgi:hypothetical protein
MSVPDLLIDVNARQKLPEEDRIQHFDLHRLTAVAKKGSVCSCLVIFASDAWLEL